MKSHFKSAGKTGTMNLRNDRTPTIADRGIRYSSRLIKEVTHFAAFRIDTLKDLEVDASRECLALTLQNHDDNG